jgi:RNA polymerase sigma factor (sigma-70 family)
VPFEDLLQAGMLGLIDALNKFDSEKNVKFASYAKFRIRGAILDSLRENDWVRASRRKSKIDTVVQKLRLNWGARQSRAGQSAGGIAGRVQTLANEIETGDQRLAIRHEWDGRNRPGAEFLKWMRTRCAAKRSKASLKALPNCGRGNGDVLPAQMAARVAGLCDGGRACLRFTAWR